MRRLLTRACLLPLLLVTGCAILHLHRRAPAPAPPTPADGYVVRESRILFVFDPARYDSLADDSSGARVALAATNIETVHVAGDFNGWSRTAWKLTRDFRGVRARYALEHRLADLGAGREYAFRFLVNGRWWVIPGQRTWNRRPERSGMGGYDLLLTLE